MDLFFKDKKEISHGYGSMTKHIFDLFMDPQNALNLKFNCEVLFLTWPQTVKTYTKHVM